MIYVPCDFSTLSAPSCVISSLQSCVISSLQSCASSSRRSSGCLVNLECSHWAPVLSGLSVSISVPFLDLSPRGVMWPVVVGVWLCLRVSTRNPAVSGVHGAAGQRVLPTPPSRPFGWSPHSAVQCRVLSTAAHTALSRPTFLVLLAVFFWVVR